MSVSTKMTAIADLLRKLWGKTGALTQDNMNEILTEMDTATAQVNADLSGVSEQLNEIYGLGQAEWVEETMAGLLAIVPQLYLFYCVFVILTEQGLNGQQQSLTGAVPTTDENSKTIIDPYISAMDSVVEDKEDAYTAVLSQAGTVPESKTMENLAAAIRSIPIVAWASIALDLFISLTTIQSTDLDQFNGAGDTAMHEYLTSVATNAQTKLAESYTAVSNKNGTVPSATLQKIENLPAAIESIPVFTVQRKTGTFTVVSGEFEVSDVGFKPDVVLITGQTDTSYGTTYEYQLAVVFPEKTTGDTAYLTSVGWPSKYPYGQEFGFLQTETGFTGYGGCYLSSGSYADITNIPFSYVAIKYTE